MVCSMLIAVKRATMSDPLSRQQQHKTNLFTTQPLRTIVVRLFGREEEEKHTTTRKKSGFRLKVRDKNCWYLFRFFLKHVKL